MKNLSQKSARNFGYCDFSFRDNIKISNNILNSSIKCVPKLDKFSHRHSKKINDEYNYFHSPIRNCNKLNNKIFTPIKLGNNFRTNYESSSYQYLKNINLNIHIKDGSIAVFNKLLNNKSDKKIFQKQNTFTESKRKYSISKLCIGQAFSFQKIQLK